MYTEWVLVHREKTKEQVSYKLEIGRSGGKPACQIMERWEKGFKCTEFSFDPFVAETAALLLEEIKRQLRELEMKAGYKDAIFAYAIWPEAPWPEKTLGLE